MRRLAGFRRFRLSSTCNKPLSNMERRNFLRQMGCLTTVASLANLNASLALAQHNTAQSFPLAIFSKVFKNHSFDQLADSVVEMDADGVEATIRDGGHIEPNKAESQVPELVAALTKRNKRLLIAASDINATGPDSVRLLKTLRENGVTHYRMGYYKYRSGTSMLDQARAFAAKAKELADLNRELGMTGLYQNHFGNGYVGNLLWDLAIVMEGISPDVMGIAIDLRHLRAEISGSYQSALDSVRANLSSVYLKDTRRIGESRAGDTRDMLDDVPLGEGMVNRELFRNAWQSLNPVPLSVHVEYFGQNPIAPDKIGPIVEAYKRDVATLRSWMA